MKVKRILAALAAAAILCGMTGCGSGGSTSDTSADRRLVSLTKNGRPESPGVLRGASGLNNDSGVSDTTENTD